MSVKLRSTKAKVRDPEKARKSLAEYKVDAVKIKLTQRRGAWTLVMSFTLTDTDNWEMPLALHRIDWPDEERFPGREVLEDEWYKRFLKKGGKGFLALLRDLAPTLETPLLILVMKRGQFDDDSAEAVAWCVQPGAKEVVTVDV